MAKTIAASRFSGNPLRELIAAGKMPIILELHLTESDGLAFQRLRQRHLSRGYELPNLVVMGEYLREMEPSSTELGPAEQTLVHKLQVYADLACAGAVDLVAMDDGSRGRDSLDNAVAAELLIGLGVDPSRLMANVVARNRQAEQIRGRLMHFAELGVRNVLLLTGDLPANQATRAVFPLDSIGMCELARRMQIEGALPEDVLVCAAGHPNPDVDPEGLHTLHKALAGARVIITQAIYSVEMFTNWMNALQRQGVLDMVHVLAEIIPITSAEQLRVITEVPGMRVPEELIEQLASAEARIRQLAAAGNHDEAWFKGRLRIEGIRVTRELLHRIRKVQGVSGFYLGCVKGFEAHQELLKEAPLLPERAEALHKVTKISGAERQRALAELPRLEAGIERIRRQVRRQRRWLRFTKPLAASTGVERVLRLLEWPKVPIFGCKKCDRCDLSPDALICPRGCAKQMTHGPCGAPRRVNDRVLCEDTSRECTWVAIRQRRRQLGISLAEQLEIRPAPSAEFYEGRTYVASLPVLDGRHRGPNWRLAWKAPLAWLGGWLGREVAFSAAGTPRDLFTLFQSKSERLRTMLMETPEADSEELLVKVLALIGTPAAWHLIESRLTELGLPSEGTMADLSIREQFLLAEALPLVRRRSREGIEGAGVSSAAARCEELLAVIPEGRHLRRNIRRELAQNLISHITSLGARVTYMESLLDSRQVENFLLALGIVREELQVARDRLPLDGKGLGLHFHRVHYKHHFHAPISLQRFTDAGGQPLPRVMLRLDMRQFRSPAAFRLELRRALEWIRQGKDESSGGILLEPFRAGGQSLCWQFNIEFWKRLREFEQAAGVDYDASIGGSTDHNLTYARSSARALYDRVREHGLGGEPLFVLEVGVASTHRARSFLKEFRRVCEIAGADYYQRTTYVLADYSPIILEKSTEELRLEHPSVEAVRLDAGNPTAALAPYRGRVIHAHLCNVFDNLPADQAQCLDGRWYRVDMRLYLPEDTLDDLIRKHGLSTEDRRAVQELLSGLSNRGDGAVAELLDWARARFMELGRGPLAYVGFWMDLYAALRFDERYVEAARLDDVVKGALPEAVSGAELLRNLLVDGRDIRIHVNYAALAGFAELMRVLHPFGTLEVVDLFVQRLDDYHAAFKGPAKYDGSTVNWLNGPLFRVLAERLGGTVRFQPFRPFDPKSVSVVLLAHPGGMIPAG
jgi:5,10-methylenetetrahydrofolate reductase